MSAAETIAALQAENEKLRTIMRAREKMKAAFGVDGDKLALEVATHCAERELIAQSRLAAVLAECDAIEKVAKSNYFSGFNSIWDRASGQLDVVKLIRSAAEGKAE